MSRCTLIKVVDASVAYAEDDYILADLDLSVNPGDVILIKGKSGSGKTTLAKFLSGFLSPGKGHITWQCSVNLMLNKGVGLKPDLNLFDNALIRYLNFNSSLLDAKEKAMEVIEFARLSDFSSRPLSSLPSLLKSRFALCLYLLNSYDVLIVDEMIGLRDPAFKAGVGDVVRHLVENSAAIIVFARPGSKTLFDPYITRSFSIDSSRLVEVKTINYG